MPLPRLATDAQLDELLDGALTTLAETGFLFQDEELVRMLVRIGCLDEGGGRVRIPRQVVGEMLAPRLAEPERGPEGPPKRSGEWRVQIGTQIAQFYLDPESGRRLTATRDLLAEVTRFAHVWQPGAAVGPALLCRDVPAPVEPIEAVLALAENTDRVATAYVHYAAQIPYLAELGRILTGDAVGFLGICIFAVTPLRLDARACRLLVELTRLGVPVWMGTQPAAGASSPVTAPGTVVLAAAEVLAGWVASFAVDPAMLPGAGICSGVLDMRTADVSYCAPEAMLQDLLCVELFAQRCGGRCHVAGGAGYTDAKWPGLQKAFEVAFEALAIYAYTGAGPYTASGLLESGKTFSPVQFVLDQELGDYLWRFARGVSFEGDALALAAIRDVGLGFRASHLSTDHTLGNWRNIWVPTLLDRGCWQGDAEEREGEERVLRAAWKRYQDVRAAYEPASVGEDRLAAVRAVVESSWRDLCGRERPAPA